MPMQRKELIALMEEVAPALSVNMLVPVLSHFWFTGKTVMTYNDHIAISVPCVTDFAGAVPQSLLALLKTSRAETPIEFKVGDKDVLHISAAASKFKLAMMPKSDFIFKMPGAPSEPFPCDAGRFLQGLESVMHSLGNDTSHADHRGVTLITQGDYLHLFATDRATLSTARVKVKGDPGFDRVILTTDFCKQLLRIGKGAKKLLLDITDKDAVFEHDGVTLFGLNETPEAVPLDFLNIMKQAYTSKHKQALCDIPSKFEPILDRACIITDAAIDKTKTIITVSQGKGKNPIMHFDSVSERGECHDSMEVGEMHPNVTAHVDPKRLKDGFGRYGKFLITEEAAIMVSSENDTVTDMVYLVSATPG
jgi:hypothetical protein